MLWILRALWGDLTNEEFKKFGILSLAIAVILGNYWMLRITKDPLFDLLVGLRKWQPVAKMFSLVVMIFIVLGYSKLIDLMKKQRLIYLICSIYGGAFIFLSYFTSHPELLTVSSTSAFYPFVSWIPGRAIGWFAYVLLESYGSLLVALFYSFVASVMTTGSAKKGYGMMAAITQFGTLSGILLSMFYTKRAGVPAIYFLGGLIALSVPFIVRFYLSQFPQDSEVDKKTILGKPKKEKKTGFFEGLRLIASRPYIAGIFVVVTFYEVMSTIVEYQMNWLAVGFYPKGSADYVFFRGIQAIGINIVALLFAFIGTSFFMRKFGLKFCLLTFPVTIGVVLTANFAFRMLGFADYSLMWVLLSATVAIKGLNYALNKPTAEVMYIPTSKDVKFKAKGWIDMFGNRSTKGMGATVTNSFGHSFPALILYGTIISLGVLGVWIVVARYVGNKFDRLQETGDTVE
jgi:AAA family ATP:ADP antiporter